MHLHEDTDRWNVILQKNERTWVNEEEKIRNAWSVTNFTIN